MSKKLYKYVGPKILALAAEREGYVGFKCSYPKDYNDPYELFLSIDPNIEPELLAFYTESVGSIPQIPTSCFSKSPVVVPMWAHYGHSSRGFVIEIDEEKLASHFEDVSIDDIRYQDNADPDIVISLAHAFGTRKPRHTFFFHKQVMHSAYFSKQTCWSYEQERRVVVPQKYIEEVNGNMIFYVPIDCITAIIAGPYIEDEYLIVGQEIAQNVNCEMYKSFIGKSYSEMFLNDNDGKVYVFNGEQIVKACKICKICNEPISGSPDTEGDNTCSWCSITEAHKRDAADSNPYRVLQHAGILEEHIRGMESIWRGKS